MIVTDYMVYLCMGYVNYGFKDSQMALSVEVIMQWRYSDRLTLGEFRISQNTPKATAVNSAIKRKSLIAFSIFLLVCVFIFVFLWRNLIPALFIGWYVGVDVRFH